MKTTAKMTDPVVGAARELPLGHPNAPPLMARGKQSLIQWATKKQIQEVSTKLAQINRVAIRSEANGDYFTSGDLAYQIQEIIRATAELFKKSQRVRNP
jgi:hypothetical protein